MKILILSYYYKPDLSAGSFRTTALIDQIKKYPDINVEVLTTKPNRYHSYNVNSVKEEFEQNIAIKRIDVPTHKIGIVDQIKSFAFYYREVQKIVKNSNYDLVFATSSRLFTAFLGARIARKKKIPLHLDIRDIFIDAVKDIFPSISIFFIKLPLSLIEKYTFSSARHINLVSRGFEEYFKMRFPEKIYTYYTNGIDAEFLDYSNTETMLKHNRKLISILYAGNIGTGQGLNNIIPELAKSLSDRVKFTIIGDGGQKEKLVQAVSFISNIEILSPVNRQELIKKYSESDVLFLHLNDYPAFKKVLPSKMFEYAATGKPILAGVTGYAADFIKSEIPNAELFYPGDYIGAIKALNKLKLSTTDRTNFIERYNRNKIMKDMCDFILGVSLDL